MPTVTEPTIVTAPGQAPEARAADREARDRAYDDLTGNRFCERCGVRHPETFAWRGRERPWHEAQPELPSRGRR